MHFKDESEDLWIKCKVNFLSTFMRDWNASFEIRLKQDQTFNELRKIVQKLVINIWNSGLKISNIYSKYITILKQVDLDIKNSLLSTFVVNSSTFKSAEDIPDSDSIRDHITYESSLRVHCRFITLEEEFNLQHPNYQKLHSRMLGFFGVGIPKKSNLSKKTDEASISSFFPARHDRSKFLFSGRKPSHAPFFGEHEDEKVGENSEKMTETANRTFSNALLFKEGTPSLGTMTHEANFRNVLYENVLLQSVINPIPEIPMNKSTNLTHSIQEDYEEVSSSLSYSSHRLQSASFHDIVEVSEEFSGQIETKLPRFTSNQRPEVRTFRVPTQQNKRSFRFSLISSNKMNAEHEKMIQMIKLPTFVLSTRDIKNIRVIVRNKKLNIEDFSQSSLQGELPLAFQDQTTVKVPTTDRKKKCAILGFVIIVFSIVILVAIVLELK